MKELLKDYMSKRENFLNLEKTTEKAFEEFLSNISNWRDRLGNIIITYGYKYKSEDEENEVGSQLILRVKDLRYYEKEGLISFKIRYASDSSGYFDYQYYELVPFPFHLLTDPEFIPDKNYLRDKLQRRKSRMESLRNEESYLNKMICETESEIRDIKNLLGEE